MASFSSHADENLASHDMFHRGLFGARIGAGPAIAGDSAPADRTAESGSATAELCTDAGPAQ